jgi:hypothetical protein
MVGFSAGSLRNRMSRTEIDKAFGESSAGRPLMREDLQLFGF